MIKKLFSSQPLWLNNGLLIIRLITGAFMIYHGWEVFSTDKMKGYIQWLTDLHFPVPAFMAYAGKTIELISGISLVLGLFTRFMMLPLAFTMTTVTFGMGHGKVLLMTSTLFYLYCWLWFSFLPGRESGVWTG
jgi:putative oxidoreductase